jgi:hypothetical protein
VLNRVHYRREQFVIARNGESLALLTPIGATSRISLAELAAQLRGHRAIDKDFADDLEAIQTAQSTEMGPTWP